MALRIPLVLLPEPGRDEAAYFHWAEQGELGYAPLLMALVRGFRVLGLPALLAIRLPSLVGGVLSLVLLDRLLSRQGLAIPARSLATTALAITPWHVWVGSVLHPDPWLLSALLALALSIQTNRRGSAALFGGLAALAKPTGLVVVPIVLGWCVLGGTLRARLLSSLVLLGLSIPAAAGLSPAMLHEMSMFGRLSPGLPLWRLLVIAIQDFVLTAGFLLPVVVVGGLRSDLERSTPSSRGKAIGSLAPAVALLIFFTGAAVLNRQIKAGWLLPALVLAWPRAPLRVSRETTFMLYASTLLLTVLMIALARSPDLVEAVESRLGRFLSYEDRAGVREGGVSPTRTWSHRVREYDGVGALAADVLRARWKVTGLDQPPRCLVSDDYGLATQVVYHWRSPATRVVVPDDGFYQKGLSALKREDPGQILILSTQKEPGRVWGGGGPTRVIGRFVHPATGGAVQVAVFQPPRPPESSPTSNFEATAPDHDAFDDLLGRYVTDDGVRYFEWASQPDDVRRLADYLKELASVPVDSLRPEAALAYWINLYNAVTLNLVLSNYPVKSIKDTGGLLKSPWKKKLVSVSGQQLSLDDIENKIIRPRFRDARIHFALNCASVGCPPLAPQAYRDAVLEEQLDAACRRALNDGRWVRLEGSRLVLSKIFDWYRQDFEDTAGSVPDFIARYRSDGGVLLDGVEHTTIRYTDYDWSLNESR